MSSINAPSEVRLIFELNRLNEPSEAPRLGCEELILTMGARTSPDSKPGFNCCEPSGLPLLNLRTL